MGCPVARGPGGSRDAGTGPRGAWRGRGGRDAGKGDGAGVAPGARGGVGPRERHAPGWPSHGVVGQSAGPRAAYPLAAIRSRAADIELQHTQELHSAHCPLTTSPSTSNCATRPRTPPWGEPATPPTPASSKAPPGSPRQHGDQWSRVHPSVWRLDGQRRHGRRLHAIQPSRDRRPYSTGERGKPRRRVSTQAPRSEEPQARHGKSGGQPADVALSARRPKAPSCDALTQWRPPRPRVLDMDFSSNIGRDRPPPTPDKPALARSRSRDADVRCYSLPTAACQVLAEIVLAAHRAARKGNTEAA